MQTLKPEAKNGKTQRRFGKLHNRMGRFLSALKVDYRLSPALMLVFVPGMLFIAMSIAVFFAPKIFVVLLSGLLFSLGIGAIWLGFKALYLHHKFRDVIQQVEARIYVKGAASETTFQDVRVNESKKTMYH